MQQLNEALRRYQRASKQQRNSVTAGEWDRGVETVAAGMPKNKQCLRVGNVLCNKPPGPLADMVDTAQQPTTAAPAAAHL